jgi:hypothetical protein
MTISKPGRALAAFALLACMTQCYGDEPSAIAQLARLVGDRGVSDVGDFRDCSQMPIEFLDAHTVEDNTTPIYQWVFVWAKFAIDGGTCIYLEKPERRGLTSEEARVLMSAVSNGIEFPDEPEYVCPARDLRDVDSERTEVSGQGEGFTYHFSYVEAQGDLAPFERLQREFAARQMALSAATAKSPGKAGEKRTLGISFELSKRGDFASLMASYASPSNEGFRPSFAGWLLHTPSGRVLAFDDLFVDPRTARDWIVAKARPYLMKRLHDIDVHDRTEEQRQSALAQIDQRVLDVTNPSHAAAWQVTLDYVDACEPGLLLTFDAADLMPTIMERPEVRLGLSGIRDMLKPEFRTAFGERIDRIAKKPAFSSERVAQLFPALIETSKQHLLPISELQPDLVECSAQTPEALGAEMTAERSQWIYNGWYRWVYDAYGTGTCVVLLYPEQRGLSRDEAWALLSAAKRKLPFEEARLDPAFAIQYSTDVAQSFGGMPTFERGSLKGVDYTIGFVGIGAPLRALDAIQHRAARTQITIMEKRARRHRAAGAFGRPPAKLTMDFVSGGRTAELTVLVLQGTRVFADGRKEDIAASWLLHVPSGKVIAFDDLFVDPAAVRNLISEQYRGGIEARMGFYAFVGDDAEKQIATFRDTYRRAAYRLSAPTREHFKHVRFSTGPGEESVFVSFSDEALAPGDYASGNASVKRLKKYLKPEYRHALDSAIDAVGRP